MTACNCGPFVYTIPGDATRCIKCGAKRIYEDDAEQDSAVRLARAHLPDLATADADCLRAELEVEQEKVDRLYGLNCQLNAALDKVRDENAALRAAIAELQRQLQRAALDYTADYRDER